MSVLILFAVLALTDPWRRHVLDDASIGADGVRLADVDGDGRADVVTPWEEGGVVRVAFRPGPEAVRRRWPAVTVGRVDKPEDAVAVDLDGDGLLEIVSCSEAGGGRVCVHACDGDPREEASWSTHTLGDSEGRQKSMFAAAWPAGQGGGLVVGGKGDGAAVDWWRPGDDPSDWSAWRGRRLRRAGWVMSLIVEDMDGDGDADLLLTDRTRSRRGCVWLEFEAGRDRWREHPVGGADAEVMFAATADLDGDGDRDVVCATYGRALLLFERLDGSGDRWRRHELGLPDDGATGKAVAVVEGDGRTELCVTRGNAAGVCPVLTADLPRGDSVWRPKPQWQRIGGTAGTKFDLIVPVDLDGDGDLDLLTCEERERLGVVWYERPGGSNE